jgi:hypothetical protein
MNSPAVIFSFRWFVWDTFRQAQSSAILWAMLIVSGICILFAATTSTVNLPARYENFERLPAHEVASPEKARAEGIEIIDGEIRFLFGAVSVRWSKPRDDAIRWVQLVLAGGIADTFGLLLALIWTSTFLPSFLEPASATMLLAKPIPRWLILAGKFFGVITLVSFQAMVFVLGTWLALGCSTGVWDPHYLLSIPLLVLHFTVFFSFSCLLAVWTRSTSVCIFGSLLFWLLCWGMNYGRHAHAYHDVGVSALMSGGLELGYWLLPKPADFGYALSQVLAAQEYNPAFADFTALSARGALNLPLSILSSLGSALMMLAAAGYELTHSDY